MFFSFSLSNLLYLTLAQRIFIFMFEQTCDDKSSTEHISSLFRVHVYTVQFMCIFYYYMKWDGDHADATHSPCSDKEQGEHNFNGKTFELSEQSSEKGCIFSLSLKDSSIIDCVILRISTILAGELQFFFHTPKVCTRQTTKVLHVHFLK